MKLQDCLKYSIHNCEELFETPLGKAFENLNNQGIKAYMNCGWERKESLDIITGDNYDGEWVLFTEQIYEFLIEDNECSLAYGAGAEDEVIDLKPLAQKIIKALEEQGIICEWNGNTQSQIFLKLNYRQRDQMSFRTLFRASFLIPLIRGCDENLYMLEMIADYLMMTEDEDCESYREYLDYWFSSSREDFIAKSIELFKQNDEFSCLEDKGVDISIYEDEDDFLSKLDWDEILNAMKKYTDKEYLENKISSLND